MPAIRVLEQQRTIRGGFGVKTRDSEAFKAWFGCCPHTCHSLWGLGCRSVPLRQDQHQSLGLPLALCLAPAFQRGGAGKKLWKGALKTRPVLLGILLAWKVYLAQLMASAILVSLFSSACTTSSRTSRGYATAALLQRQKIVQHEV